MTDRKFLLIALVLLLLTGCHRTAPTGTLDRQRHQIDSILDRCDDIDSLKMMVTAYEKTGNRLGQASAIRMLGKVYRDLSRFEEAIDCHQQSVKLSEMLGDTIELVRGLNNLGTDYRRLGILDMASECHYRALSLSMSFADKTSDDARKNYTVSLNGLGNVYLDLDNHEMADSIFRVALNTEQRLGSKLGQAINNANIGAVLEEDGQLDSAYHYYEQSLRCNEEAGSKLGIALCHIHFGNIFQKKHQAERAIQEYAVAYEQLEQEGDTWHWLESCLSLSRIYAQQGRNELAHQYLALAEQKAEEIKSTEHLADIHAQLYELARREGKIAEALNHYVKADSYGDSLFNLRTMNHVQNLRLKIERQRREEAVKMAENNLRLERQSRNIAYLALAALFMVFLLVLLLMLNNIRNRSRSQQMSREMQEARENFFTNITHEFRTPLTVILGLTQQLIQKAQGVQDDDSEDNPSMPRARVLNTDSQDTMNSLKSIERQGNHLLQLINQLLDISKVKSSVGDSEWTHGNIVAFVHMLVENYRQYAMSQKIELSYQPDQNIVEMDFVPDFIEKIVSNLISNSMKYTKPYGHITIVTRKMNDDEMQLTVSDDGIGISPDVLPHVFKPFFQGSDDTANVGTGIGLALVKNITEAMKGSISVASTPGNGTTFTLTMPLKHGDKQPKLFSIDDYNATVGNAADNDSRPTDEEDATENTTRVLVVEDNSDVAYYIGQQLATEHFKIFYAQNGQEGLARARDLMPDLIITDLMMPGMDGLEFCRQLRASELLSHIPIIIITAKATDKDRISGIEAGADAYLVKPFNAAVLQVRIKKLLEQRRLLREKFSQALDEGRGITDEMKPADRQFIAKAKEIVLSLMKSRQVDAETLANHMFVSRAQLNRKMQAISGLTTTAFITQVRIGQAKRLLSSNPDMPVSEVSMKCGYDDVAYFSRTFKQTTGMTPSQFKLVKS